jgi:hypothetical protein
MRRLIAAALDVDIATAGINDEINELSEEQVRVQSLSDSRVKKLAIAGILFGAASLIRVAVGQDNLERMTANTHSLPLVYPFRANAFRWFSASTRASVRLGQWQR